MEDSPLYTDLMGTFMPLRKPHWVGGVVKLSQNSNIETNGGNGASATCSELY